MRNVSYTENVQQFDWQKKTHWEKVFELFLFDIFSTIELANQNKTNLVYI